MKLPEQLAEAADSLLGSHYRSRLPGSSVTINCGGQVVLHKTYGEACLNPRRAVEPETGFRIGSLTKLLTAALVLRAVDQGKLSLSDKLAKIDNRFRRVSESLTIYQLLSHTSGIPAVSDSNIENLWMDTSESHVKAVVAEKSVGDFAPGARWRYSDYNYVILGMVLEGLVGKDLSSMFEDEFIHPLNMSHTRYSPSQDGLHLEARDYYLSENGYYYPCSWNFVRPPLGEAGLISTSYDLSKWFRSFFEGDLVSSKLVRLATSPCELTGGAKTRFGFSLALTECMGYPVLEHGGAINGYRGHMIFLPRNKTTIVILSNSVDDRPAPSYLAFRIAAFSLNQDFSQVAVRLAPSEMKRYVGTYRSSLGLYRVVTENGQLYLRSANGRRWKLLCCRDLVFQLEDSLTKVEFFCDIDGVNTMVLENRFLGPETALRV